LSSLLTNDDRWDHLKDLGFQAAVGEFRPRSTADHALLIDPETTQERIVALLSGYVLAWGTRTHRMGDLVFRRPGELLRLNYHGSWLQLDLLSEAEDARCRLDELMARFEPVKFKNQEDDGVWVQFAHRKAEGVARTTQFLRCPAWPEIRENYGEATRSGIEGILGLERPWGNGRLLIWHGPPGTGKTFALRALMMEWRKRFDFMVVTDPEQLAADPAYYFEVASEPEEGPKRYGLNVPRRVSHPDEESEKRKRRLFILEDSADLILQESRSSHFDKIGKLLNMTDGLFGQGRQDLFLLTFNEDVDRIDPAFLRPGRCIARVDFPRFDRPGARAWLETRGRAIPPARESMSLAELYAAALSDAPVPEPRPERVGFGARG
jgi:hypothetical protein